MNERLAESHAETAPVTSAAWFRLIAENTEDYIAVLDCEGRRLYVNPALVRLLGEERARVGTSSFGDVHVEDRARVVELFERTVADGYGRRAEFRVLLADGTLRYIESQGNTIRDAEGRVAQVVVVSRDVTERRRIEDALRAREMQLQAAQEIAHLGSWEWDVRSDEIWWSPELRAIYGVDSAFEPNLASSRAMVHPEDLAAFDVATREASERGQIYDKPYRIVRPDGSVRTLFASGRMEHDARGQFVRLVGVCQDITDRRWIEERARSTAERLRSISRRLVEAQEADRRQLARELHDRVGQALAALGLNLKLVATELAARAEHNLTGRLEDCLGLVEDTVAAMRGVMGELRPQALDDYGLVAALRTYAESFTARTGIKVTVSGRGKHALPKPVELAMFRIAQEALTNVAKHSRATAVEAECRSVDGRTVFLLLDDGVGFEPERPAGAAGWGLVIMRERAESVGAAFSVSSGRGRGARILVQYPG
jgi:two-component system sensor histidine kinase UhpB